MRASSASQNAWIQQLLIGYRLSRRRPQPGGRTVIKHDLRSAAALQNVSSHSSMKYRSWYHSHLHVTECYCVRMISFNECDSSYTFITKRCHTCTTNYLLALTISMTQKYMHDGECWVAHYSTWLPYGTDFRLQGLLRCAPCVYLWNLMQMYFVHVFAQ